MTPERFADAINDVNTRVYREKKRSGLSEVHYMALHVIRRGVVVGDVMRALGILPATMSRILRTLTDRGLATVEINDGDRRKLDVRLTAEGKAALEKWARMVEEVMA